MSELEVYTTGIKPTWCPGCGNFGLWTGLKNALKQEEVKPWEAVVVAGIGCHAHLVNFTETNGFIGLHGRPLPVARGIKLANPELLVIVSTGDGDCLGEGGNHYLHTARGNHDIVVLIHDNQVYGLTTGQTSPTSLQDFQSKSTPLGNPDKPINPIALALASGATYVARGFAGEVKHLTELMVGAIQHKGFAVVDVLQPCVSFNKLNTFKYFKERVYCLEEEKYQPDNRLKALERSLEWGKRIPLGLFYQEEKPAFHERVGQTKAVELGATLTSRNLSKLFKKLT
jgi:2-oxoglutarate ferredoxin oxidoreductase subunit beta